VEFYDINTNIGSATSNLQKRLYQAPVSTALDLGFGFSRFNNFILLSSLSNTSADVAVLQDTATFQIYAGGGRDLAYLTSLGLYYSSYSVSLKSNPTSILDSVTTYSPLLEERLVFILRDGMRPFIAMQIYYPVMSSDPDNGSSSVGGSFGLGTEGGVRVDFNKLTAIEAGVGAHYLSMAIASTGVSELEWSVFGRLLFTF